MFVVGLDRHYSIGGSLLEDKRMVECRVVRKLGWLCSVEAQDWEGNGWGCCHDSYEANTGTKGVTAVRL